MCEGLSNAMGINVEAVVKEKEGKATPDEAAAAQAAREIVRDMERKVRGMAMQKKG